MAWDDFKPLTPPTNNHFEQNLGGGLIRLAEQNLGGLHSKEAKQKRT